MKNIIQQIIKEYSINIKPIKESDDFEWLEEFDIESMKLSPGLIYYKFGDNESVRDYVAENVCDSFDDLTYEGGKIYLTVDSWCDFLDLFEDYRGGGDVVTRYIAKKMLCDDDGDYWEYYDEPILYRDWKDYIWDDIILKNENLTEFILNYIKTKYVVPIDYNPKQLDIFGELPKKRYIFKINGRVLDNEYFEELKDDLDLLGNIIDEEDDFSDLKNETFNCYTNAYNQVIRDNIWNSIKNAIEQDFGQHKFVTTTESFSFNITNLFWQIILPYYKDSFSHNIKGRGMETKEEMEELDEYCPECGDISYEYSTFLSFIERIFHDNNDSYNPRFNDYASADDIMEYFIDDIQSRI